MTLSELNGYLTGIIVNPETIQPSRWLPRIWGDDAVTAFETMKDPETTVDLIIDHYNTISRLLAHGSHYEAILTHKPRDPEEKPWEAWIEGFMSSIDLAPKSWDILTAEQDEEAEAALEILYVLNDLTATTPVLPQHDLEEIDDAAPALLRECVMLLNRFRQTHSTREAPMALNVSSEVYSDNVVPFPGKRKN